MNASTPKRYRPKMKWYLKLIIFLAIATLVAYIGSMVYLVTAKYKMNDYTLELGATFNAATMVNASTTHTDAASAVIARYKDQSAVVVPENYPALTSYLRREHAMPLFAFVNKDKALHIAVCDESHFYIVGDKSGDGATVRLESAHGTYTMHITGSDVYEKILDLCLKGSQKYPNLPVTDA